MDKPITQANRGGGMKYEKQIKSKDLHMGCLNCSTACLRAPLNMMIVAGFGGAYISKNGKEIYNGESDYHKRGKAKTLRYFELLARKSQKADWRLVKIGPLHSETFQRQGKNNWVCIESNKGFA